MVPVLYPDFPVFSQRSLNIWCFTSPNGTFRHPKQSELSKAGYETTHARSNGKMAFLSYYLSLFNVWDCDMLVYEGVLCSFDRRSYSLMRRRWVIYRHEYYGLGMYSYRRIDGYPRKDTVPLSLCYSCGNYGHRVCQRLCVLYALYICSNYANRFTARQHWWIHFCMMVNGTVTAFSYITGWKRTYLILNASCDATDATKNETHAIRLTPITSPPLLV
jgi:hypothetical protein